MEPIPSISVSVKRKQGYRINECEAGHQQRVKWRREKGVKECIWVRRRETHGEWSAKVYGTDTLGRNVEERIKVWLGVAWKVERRLPISETFMLYYSHAGVFRHGTRVSIE